MISTPHADKQVTHSAEVGALDPVYKKTVIEPKPELKLKLIRCKSIVNIARFNIRTLNTVNQLPELTASTDKHHIDIICIQEYRFYHSKLEIK